MMDSKKMEGCWQKEMCIWWSRNWCYVDAGQSCCDDCPAFERRKQA